MSRFKENTGLSRLQTFRKGTITASSVRVEQIACFPIGFLHCFTNLFICIGRTRDFHCNGSMIVVIQCQYTSKITGIAHIHRIGNGSDGRTGIILSGLQVLIEYVIAVVGRYKTLHRQTHALAEQTGRYIAKVTARHTYHHIIRLTFFLQLCVGIEIIECLRQETGHVNRICRSQFHVRIQVSIHKRILHQCLTIVKRTVYFQSRNILSQRSELLFLNFADLSFGIKHIHMDTFHSQEAIGSPEVASRTFTCFCPSFLMK